MPQQIVNNKVRISVNPPVRRCFALFCAVLHDRGRSLKAEEVLDEKASVFDRWITGEGEDE
jgi:hypothetical protein